MWMSDMSAGGELGGPEPLPAERPKPPWACRLDKTGRERSFLGLGLVDLTRWDPEPDSPTDVKEERFAPALNQLCATELSYQQSNQYAHWILEACRAFAVDPFLLASLVFQESRCGSVKPTGTTDRERTPGPSVQRSSMVRSKCGPSFHPGHSTSWVCTSSPPPRSSRS